jgi:hypothetical protein
LWRWLRLGVYNYFTHHNCLNFPIWGIRRFTDCFDNIIGSGKRFFAMAT